MGLLVFIVILVLLFFVARWAARRMRIKERVRESVQRMKERLGRFKRLVIKLVKIVVVCGIGVLTISVGYYVSLSNTEREELNRKSSERREAEAIKEQATEEKERQMALEKQEDARWTAQMRKESNGMDVQAGRDVQAAYNGLDMKRGDFDVGRYCLNEEKNGGMAFEQCIGLAVLKARTSK